MDARVEALRSEWLRILLGTAPADRPATEDAVAGLYRLHGLARPRFVWTGSPVAGSLVVGLLSGGVILTATPSLGAALADPRWDVIGHRLRESVSAALAEAYGHDLRMADPLRNRLTTGHWPRHPWWDSLDRSVRQSAGPLISHPWFLRPFEGHIPGDWLEWTETPSGVHAIPVPGLPGWLQHAVTGDDCGVDPAMAATLDLWRRTGLAHYDEEATVLLDQLVTVARSCAWLWTYPKVCVLVERPAVLAVEQADEPRPHNADGPAIEYRDGLVRHAWHGVLVPEKVITGALTGADWLHEANVEIRRAIAERMGHAWLLDECGATKIAADEYGTLWRLRDPVDETTVLLDVVNSTPEPDGTFRRYVLRVPPDQTVPRDAIGWTFGLPPGGYGPTAMT